MKGKRDFSFPYNPYVVDIWTFNSHYLYISLVTSIIIKGTFVRSTTTSICNTLALCSMS